MIRERHNRFDWVAVLSVPMLLGGGLLVVVAIRGSDGAPGEYELAPAEVMGIVGSSIGDEKLVVPVALENVSRRSSLEQGELESRAGPSTDFEQLDGRSALDQRIREFLKARGETSGGF